VLDDEKKQAEAKERKLEVLKREDGKRVSPRKEEVNRRSTPNTTFTIRRTVLWRVRGSQGASVPLE